MQKKELLIIGGPNGSGKTTFAKSFLKEYDYEFLNADEISKEQKKKGKGGGDISAEESILNESKSLKKKARTLSLNPLCPDYF